MSRGENTFTAKGTYGTPEAIAEPLREHFGRVDLDPCGMRDQLIAAKRVVVFNEGDVAPLEPALKEVAAWLKKEKAAKGVRPRDLRGWYFAPERSNLFIPARIATRVRRMLHMSLEGRPPIKLRGTKKFYGGDGLVASWKVDSLFLNPPFWQVRYVETRPWIRKLDEADEIFVLTKAAVSATWFQHELVPRAQACVLLEGRLTFQGEKDPAPFPCSLSYRGPRLALFKKVFSGMGVHIRCPRKPRRLDG